MATISPLWHPGLARFQTQEALYQRRELPVLERDTDIAPQSIGIQHIIKITSLSLPNAIIIYITFISHTHLSH